MASRAGIIFLIWEASNLKFLRIKIVLFLMCFFILNDSSYAAEGITLKKVEEQITDRERQISYVDCGGNKETITIQADAKHLLFIPQNKIKKIKILHDVCDFYQPFSLNIEVDSRYLKEIKQFSTMYLKKKVAFFINDELVALPEISLLLKEPEFNISCFTLEKAVALSINAGFLPNYNDICVNNKKEMKDIQSYYKFKDRENHVPPKDAMFWLLLKNTALFDNPEDKKIIKIIPAKRNVEQYFNENIKKFERNGGFIKVIYQGEIGWIKDDTAISFLSTLDNNIFLQKFFENHEQFYNSRLIAKEAIAKRDAIRKLYIKEAKNRFLNETEFKRWYFDTFGREFKELSMYNGSIK